MDSNDLQFPIGRFKPVGPITDDVRTEWIAQLAEMPGQLRHAVDGLNEAQLRTPYREGGWMVRQVVHHLADSQMNGYIRMKLALTEDRPNITPFDQDGWASMVDAIEAPIDISLTLIDALYQRWLLMLRSLSDSDWQRVFHHPESGDINVGTALGIYVWHGQHHIAHITHLRQRRGWS